MVKSLVNKVVSWFSLSDESSLGDETRILGPFFDGHWYRRQFSEFALPDTTPLIHHYLIHGWASHYSPFPLFDEAWYQDQLKGRRERRPGLVDYIEVGYRESLSPHPLFIPEFYEAQVSGPISKGQSLLEHYVKIGHQQGISPHPLFDETWYKKTNFGAADQGIPGLIHYITAGWQIGLSPHPRISADFLEKLVRSSG